MYKINKRILKKTHVFYYIKNDNTSKKKSFIDHSLFCLPWPVFKSSNCFKLKLLIVLFKKNDISEKIKQNCN